jgi:hypothetical protein
LTLPGRPRRHRGHLAVALYAFFGLGAAHATVPVLFALVGVPLLAAAAVAMLGLRSVRGPAPARAHRRPPPN